MSGFIFAHPRAIFLFILFSLFVIYELRKRRSFWLSLPRFAWLILAVFLLSDLQLVRSVEYSEPEPLDVYLDVSDSVVGIPERSQKLYQFVSEIKDWAASEKQNVNFYQFGKTLRPYDGIAISQGDDQSLFSSLSSQLSEKGRRHLIVSDGNFEDRFRPNSSVQFISLASSQEKDIWLSRLQTVSTAFLKNRLNIPVEISHRGFQASTVEVELLRGNEVLETKSVRLESELNAVEFGYFPEKMGEELLAIRAKPLEGEISNKNNVQSFRVRTVRDKIRILHIGGKPSLDLKAWRLFLTRQPDVDLVSFYILRSLNDDPQASNSELSLIPFPYDELFTVELSKFDIVILQNFNFSLYFQAFYLSNLARFVRNGGALLMFGGDQSFPRYARSPLANMLPFQFNSSSELTTGQYQAQVKMKHPLVDGLTWAFEKPVWHSRHSLAAASGESKSLVSFSDGTPFLGIREVGEGRVLAFNTDESWRFQLQPYGKYPALGSIARRSLQYLTFDPEMDEKKIDSNEWSVGKEVLLKTQDQELSDWSVESLYWNTDFKIDQKSKSSISFLLPHAGVFQVHVGALDKNFIYETIEKPWLREWKNILSHPEKVKNILRASQSNYWEYEDRAKALEKTLAAKQVIAQDSSVWLRRSKWLSSLVLACILGLLCLDFFLRKKYQWDL